MDSLSGKVIVITGASTGIGAATAQTLVKLGCKVALAARSVDKLKDLAEELGPAALCIPTDVTLEADVSNMVDRTLKTFGRIDGLLANAGIYIRGKIYEGDPNDWARLIDVNVTGVMRCVHAVLPHLRPRNPAISWSQAPFRGSPIFTGNPYTVHQNMPCKVSSTRCAAR